MARETIFIPHGMVALNAKHTYPIVAVTPESALQATCVSHYLERCVNYLSIDDLLIPVTRSEYNLFIVIPRKPPNLPG